MIHVHNTTKSTSEVEAAELLAKRAREEFPELERSNDIRLELFPSIQCYGQRTQDIDLLVIYADYRNEEDLLRTKNGRPIHSFCLTVEVKGLNPEAIQFNGANCSVIYNDGQRHDVSAQSNGQKYSLKAYIENNIEGGSKPPWIVNAIWLTKLSKNQIPNQQHNILGADSKWSDFLGVVGLLYENMKGDTIRTFTSEGYLHRVTNVFSRRMQATKIDRKRLEAITKIALDKNKALYAEKFRKQLLIFRGGGGTGKTVQLIRIAYQAYNEFGLRVILLTYNKALVADLSRLLVLLGAKVTTGGSSITVRTIHGFMYDWLLSLEVYNKKDENYIRKYSEYKAEALSLLSTRVLSNEDVENARALRSRDLAWDLLLIDESQDWPSDERDLIFQLYDYKSVVLADGIDQFVRSNSRIDWRENLPSKSSQIVTLSKSLRLKSTLCATVNHFAKLIDHEGWNLEPQDETHGGRLIVIEGDALSDNLHKRLIATAKSDGNKPVDMLLCVPPSWVDKLDGKIQSRVGKWYIEHGYEVWDGVDSDERSCYPTSPEQFRIIQYESCRGLEGWVVFNFGLDEFYDHKVSSIDFTQEERSDMYFDQEVASQAYAKKWLMITLTRAIDTLVLHISSRDSYVGRKLLELKEGFPDEVEWIKI